MPAAAVEAAHTRAGRFSENGRSLLLPFLFQSTVSVECRVAGRRSDAALH